MKKINKFLFLSLIVVNSYSQNSDKINNINIDLPKTYAEKLNLGFNFGAVHTVYGDEFNKLFYSDLGLAIAIDLFYKKLFLGFNVLYTSSKLNQNLIIDDFSLDSGLQTMVNNGNIIFGYSVYETQRFRILPFLGFGRFTFVVVSNNSSNETASIKNATFGLNFDLKSNKKTSSKPNLIGYYERNNFYLRAKIFMSNSLGESSLKGNSFNFGLIIGIQGSMLKSIN